MKRLSRIYRLLPGFRRVKRAWRSRGFGIHSPFAFRFVTCVLRERGEYYAYTELRRMKGGRRELRKASLLFRLVCEFQPAMVIVSGDEAFSQKVRRIVGLADSRPEVVGHADVDAAALPGGRVMCVAASGDALCGQSLLDSVMGRDGVAVCLDTSGECVGEMRGRLRHGMSFYNRRTLVLVSRRDLPRQDFEVNF